MLSRSGWQKVVATAFAALSFVALYHVTIFDARYAAIQAVLRESLREHAHETARVVLPREDHDEVVCVADEMRAAFQPRHHLLRKPLVEDIVEVNVREKRRDDSALWCPFLRLLPYPVFHHSGLQPFVYQPEYHSVPYSLAQKLPQVVMR